MPTMLTLNINLDTGSIVDAEDIAVVQPSVRKNDYSGPLSHDARRELFGLFDSVFTSRSDEARYVFTRLALGLPADALVSWAEFKPGRITAYEALRVADALRSLEDEL